MKNKAMSCLLVGSLFLGLTGCSNEEGGNALKGKTFEATQNGANDYLLTFRDDGTIQVKENGNLGRTDEGTYKVADKKTKDGYYKVTFDKLTQHAGYVDDDPEAGYWLLDKDKDGNPVLRAVKSYCKDITDSKSCVDYMPSKKIIKTENNEKTEVEDVFLKEKK